MGVDAKVGGDSIFEIASLTKIFTALLLADASIRGEVGLDDPLQDFVPAGVLVPGFGGRAITLADLATHTSGLPLRPNNLNAASDEVNKYAKYRLNQLYEGLPRYLLVRPPGTQFEYSNLGPSLLGHGLASRLGISYADLLQQRVALPMGLADTQFGENPTSKDRRVQGYNIDLNPIPPTDFGALNPAGGLRSTANDLLTFLELFVNGHGPDRLVAAARLMLTIDRPGDDKGTRMSLGWRHILIDGESYYWSNGSGDGCRTFMAFSPAKRLGVVALANAATGVGIDDIGFHVIAPGQSVNQRIPKVSREISLTTAELTRLVGNYRYEPGDEFPVTLGVKGLLVGSGTSQFPIYPRSRTVFFAKVAEIELEFRVGAGSSQSVVLRQSGKKSVYRRIPEASGQ